MVQTIREMLDAGVREGVFPGAVLLVAYRGEVVFFSNVGYRVLITEQEPMTLDTIFDLASLTKVLATTPAMMKLVDEGKVGLDQTLSELIPALLGSKKDLTSLLLLCHSAGLPDWMPFYQKLVEHPLEDRKKIVRQWIIEEPFVYPPGNGFIYSDLGFMLLEWVIEERAGEGLAGYLHRHFYGPLGLKRTFFSGNPHRSPFKKEGNEMKEGFAATEDCPWRKRVIRGEVHDENAYALGGYSGHAGLFGTAEEVYNIVNLVREHYLGLRDDYLRPGTVRKFLRNQDLVKGSTRTLGWDTPSEEGSSAGRYFSKNSVGHTGFTGTSVWMDLDKDVIVVLLTNRVHPTRKNEKIKAFRPRIHEAIMGELGLVK